MNGEVERRKRKRERKRDRRRDRERAGGWKTEGERSDEDGARERATRRGGGKRGIGEARRKGETRKEGKGERERTSPAPPTVIIEAGVVDLF